jgi:hypothetical protein
MSSTVGALNGDRPSRISAPALARRVDRCFSD